MILTRRILARIVAIVVLGVILQLCFFSGVRVFGVVPDALPALVVVLGLLGGSMTGAVCGFSVGFLLDCLLVQPLGGGSLVLLTVGYLAGRFRERFEIHSSLVPPLLCAGLTLFAELGFGAVRLMLGVDGEVSPLILRDAVVQAIFAFGIGWAFYLALRRLLRPALVEEPIVPRRRRRRRRPRLRRPRPREA